eukprot:scaffold65349_cov35-Tisochrysis_lutea.AAC.3
MVSLLLVSLVAALGLEWYSAPALPSALQRAASVVHNSKIYGAQAAGPEQVSAHPHVRCAALQRRPVLGLAVHPLTHRA